MAGTGANQLSRCVLAGTPARYGHPLEDVDFLRLAEELGPPPQVIWVTCGNTSNDAMRRTLVDALPKAIALLDAGEPIVELTDAPQ